MNPITAEETTVQGKPCFLLSDGEKRLTICPANGGEICSFVTFEKDEPQEWIYRANVFDDTKPGWSGRAP